MLNQSQPSVHIELLTFGLAKPKGANVRFGSKADMAVQNGMSALPPRHVRCTRLMSALCQKRHQSSAPAKRHEGWPAALCCGRRHCRRWSTVNSKAISARYCSMAIDFEQGQRLALSLRRHPFFGCSTSVKRFPCAAAEPARPPPAPRSTHAAPTARTAPTSGPATYTQ